MLEYCGIGVAMGNAPDDVKAHADYVTTSVDDEGVEHALKALKII
jgi:hydroxymethylpyrimidine pyrophosphatase-like HAD family hydrolase